MNDQQQYTRNCLVVHGISAFHDPNLKEDTDKAIQNFFQKHLQITVKDWEIDRSHRLGNKAGPIIVKFCSHNVKQQIYFSKKLLKNRNFLITESLTIQPVLQLWSFLSTRKDDEKVVESYWTIDGKIFYTVKKQPNKKYTLNPMDLHIKLGVK